jgi:hypothetical protein
VGTRRKPIRKDDVDRHGFLGTPMGTRSHLNHLLYRQRKTAQN